MLVLTPTEFVPLFGLSFVSSCLLLFWAFCLAENFACKIYRLRSCIQHADCWCSVISNVPVVLCLRWSKVQVEHTKVLQWAGRPGHLKCDTLDGLACLLTAIFLMCSTYTLLCINVHVMLLVCIFQWAGKSSVWLTHPVVHTWCYVCCSEQAGCSIDPPCSVYVMLCMLQWAGRLSHWPTL